MKKILKKIIWNLKGGYKAKEFWDSWADTFIDDNWQVQTHAQHEWILQKIKDIKPQSILEIGCGFGRNIKFLIDNGVIPKKITGVDISQKMLKKAKQYINTSDVRLVISDIHKLPFSDKSFDLVLLHGILMHVSKQNIEVALKEVFRVTNKWIIAVEQNYNGNEYTFVHDYKKLLRYFGGEITEYKKDKTQGLDYFFVNIKK